MTRNRTSIIAFLSGLGSDLTNTNPPGAANTNTNPPGSANTNTNPTGKDASSTNTNPPGTPKRKTHFPFDEQAFPSWEGLDAPWTYSSEETLMMQALRKSRSKISRLGEVGAARTTALNPNKQPLWRWAPEFRSEAVSGELHSRLQVHQRAVWLVEPKPGKTGKLGLSAQQLFEVPTMGELTALATQFPDPSRPGSLMDEQIDNVLRAAIEREDRLPEILTQMRGLWPFFESITGVQLARAPAFFDLLIAVEQWMVRVLMQLKHEVAATRPVQASSMVMPLIETPGHGALPSGHAAQAAFNAELLSLLLYFDPAGKPLAGRPSRVDWLDRFARRVAFNRTVAGVHFQVDNLVGYWLGRQLAGAVAALAEPGNSLRVRRSFNRHQLVEDKFRLQEVVPGGRPPMPQGGRRIKPPLQALALAELWARARIELTEV